MAYYTYSQGFRPGGFNRTATQPGRQRGLRCRAWRRTPRVASDYQYLKPAGYDSDKLINNEIGFKSEWLDHRLQVNVSVYNMDWKNAQLPLFDPVHPRQHDLRRQRPDLHGQGHRAAAGRQLFEGFTLQGSSSWNSSEQTNAPCLQSSYVAAPGDRTRRRWASASRRSRACRTPIRMACWARARRSRPRCQFNVRARYDWAMNSTTTRSCGPAPTISAACATSRRASRRATSRRRRIPDHDAAAVQDPRLHDLRCGSIGVAKDNWTAAVTAQNLTNSDAVSNISSGQFIKSEMPLRPRVINFCPGIQVLEVYVRGSAARAVAVESRADRTVRPFSWSRMNTTESSAA